MRTLRLDFHMGSVEWVTCQVPESHWGVGAVKEGGCESWVEVVGGRRETEVGAMMGMSDGIWCSFTRLSLAPAGVECPPSRGKQTKMRPPENYPIWQFLSRLNPVLR